MGARPVWLAQKIKAYPASAGYITAQAFEVIEDLILILWRESAALICNLHFGQVALSLHANPDRGVFGRITNGVAYQINHDLQRPSKFSNGRQRFIGVRRLNANLVVRSFYCEQARGAPRNISKVDVFHHGIEIRPDRKSVW